MKGIKREQMIQRGVSNGITPLWLVRCIVIHAGAYTEETGALAQAAEWRRIYPHSEVTVYEPREK